ncbi:GntR family transcriptional regulator [Priestia megaterium]|uniref:GntR family transcriptional regulator n=1 Tax=Priestia megaterium TaxID=1404 RepID=UPI00070C1016|nr:GntR family transcriptional regulator [Priestia megaterium]KRF53972.1 hypothetical protein ASG98_18820 [Bacillus sp. Soil531]MCF6800353.1 GntR family transcriptional regulator [Bacillus sp. ET1]MED4184197.1 GntR family transcriptional regulator [Priestia megaterium]
MLTYDKYSKKPIYEQIAEYIKKLIISGEYNNNVPLPSIRFLANDLNVNINTIQKAYNKLEQQGYIYTVIGKGKFINQDHQLDKEVRIQEIKKEVLRLTREALYLGVNLEEILSSVSLTYQKSK